MDAEGEGCAFGFLLISLIGWYLKGDLGPFLPRSIINPYNPLFLSLIKNPQRRKNKEEQSTSPCPFLIEKKTIPFFQLFLRLTLSLSSNKDCRCLYKPARGASIYRIHTEFSLSSISKSVIFYGILTRIFWTRNEGAHYRCGYRSRISLSTLGRDESGSS